MPEPKPATPAPAHRAHDPRPADSPDGRTRVFIEGVSPEIDAGRFAAKGVVGDAFEVEADVVADGHDLVGAVLRHRREGEASWREEWMAPLGNDRFGASFTPDAMGFFEYTVIGFVDRYGSWARDLRKRADAGQDVAVEFLIGADMLDGAASSARGPDAKALAKLAESLRPGDEGIAARARGRGDERRTISLMRAHAERGTPSSIRGC